MDTGDQLREISSLNPVLISHNRKKIQVSKWIQDILYEYNFQNKMQSDVFQN